MRFTMSTAALASALTASLAGAQQTSTTTIAVDDTQKPVVMNGCLSGGPSGYTLRSVVTTRAAHETADLPVGTAGESTSYTLTARDGVSLAEHVGKRVEVRGVLLPPVAAAEKPNTAAQGQVKDDSNPDVKVQVPRAGTANAAAAVFPSVAVSEVKRLAASCR